MSRQAVLEMKHITKKFSGVAALNDVSFNAYEGEILALCGENGAGKSTLMKILSGAYPESTYEGEILVNGKPCHFMNPAQSEKMGIGMIYQEISMHLDLTVAENIFIGRWPMKRHKVDWKKMNAEAKSYLEMVGLQVEPDVSLRQMSASQQQLVTMLFDGVLSALVRARLFMQDNNQQGKGVSLSKAINIIENGLRVSLDEESKDELTQNLIALYSYMVRRLLQANLRNDVSAVEEVEALMRNIADAWKESLLSPSLIQDPV